MALLGTAAMLLWYDIEPAQIAAHDEWHTREHFPERVGIPGFLRAQRWVAEGAHPRYFVVYEVSEIGILSSAPYLERLNDPTPWTSRMMPSFRGMTRGFCHVTERRGEVLGSVALAVRYTADPAAGAASREWLSNTLATTAAREGIASVFRLASGPAPAMTNEQRLRGVDAGVDQVLLVTGYALHVIEALAAAELGSQTLVDRGGASEAASQVYRLACLADAPA